MNRAHANNAEEEVTIRVPRSALTVISPQPVTITQRNCFDVFGLSKTDYLRMAGKDFPVSERGQLRIALYEDVKAALVDGAHVCMQRKSVSRKQVALDPDALLRKAGFRPTR